MKVLNRIALLLLSSALFLTTACSQKETTATAQTESVESTNQKIVVAYNQAYYPYDFTDENGNADGFEVQAFKEVVELLPEYTVEFVGTSDEDLLIGVETGKYDVGLKGVWYTKERAEKYLFPQNSIAVSIIGITFRTEDADQITDLESFAKYSGKLVPIAPQSAQYAIVQQYNEEHPDNQIDLVASESFVVSDAYKWVIEKRYDAFFDIKLSYENSIVNPDGAQHALAEQLTYVPYKAIPTWPLFNKNNQKLADDYDKAIAQLKENGRLSELSQKYFSEDIFAYETD